MRVLVVFVSVLVLSAILPRSHALNNGFQTLGTSTSKDCNRICRSEFCMVPPLLKYGKYCGVLYGGCPGEPPCDGLDACCMKHDGCINRQGLLSQECSRNLLDCLAELKKTRGPTFEGNKCNTGHVIDVMYIMIEAALVIGRFLHRP